MQTNRRYELLDTLRGFSLISMIAYHFCYDLRYVFGLPLDFLESRAAFLWQQSICWVFILVSGMAVSLSRRPARRGAVVFASGMLLTAVTFWVMPGQRIVFGVLHLLGASMLLTALLRPALERVWPAAGAAGSFLLFTGCRWFERGRLFGVQVFDPGLVSTDLFAPLGVHSPGFFSADYFSVIPWYFLFLTGFFLFALLRDSGRERLLTVWAPLLSLLGRRTLGVYLLHQPVLMGICLLLLRTR